jgi:hypothetical protein
MVSKSKVFNSNPNFTVYLLVQLNILRVRLHLLKKSLNPYMRVSVKV